MRSREISTISSGLIRFLRSASRSSATVLASTPAVRAPRAAVLAVVLAAFRAVRLRAVVLPPLLAAALREAVLRPEEDLAEAERPEEAARPEDDLAAVERPEEDFAEAERPDEDFAADERPDDFAAVARPAEDFDRVDGFAFEVDLLLLVPCAMTLSSAAGEPRTIAKTRPQRGRGRRA
jgi:hypothetical protein